MQIIIVLSSLINPHLLYYHICNTLSLFVTVKKWFNFKTFFTQTL